jgi:hypothetical protein
MGQFSMCDLASMAQRSLGYEQQPLSHPLEA